MTIKEATPMMAQYLAIKREYPDCLLFYRMGDFYELFFDDAAKAAQALDIALTKRGQHDGQDIPMCGVPVHSHQAYLHKLVRQGFKIAVCEQMEDPEEARKRGAKGPLKREVIRVITAGTITEDGLLDSRGNNHLLALSLAQGEIGLAWVDISTGDFWASSCSLGGLSSQLARINPGEIIFPDKLWGDEEYKKALGDWSGVLSPQPQSRFDSTNAKIRLENFYEIKALDALGSFSRAEISAAGALLDYIELTQKGRIPRLENLKKQEEAAVLQIDAATRRNLELTRTMNGEKKGSLLGLMDKSLTGAGARLLGQYFAAPLTSLTGVNARLDGVEFFFYHQGLRANLREKLKCFPDVERALARISLGRGGPRDLALVKDSLLTAPQIQGLFDGIDAPALLNQAIREIRVNFALAEKLQKALLPDLPLLARDGGFIAPGFHPPLDELKGAKGESERLLAVLQNRYAEKTGIANLKIRHNNLIGYHIEIPSKQTEKIGPEFIHRQSMVNAVRYSTPELVELENRIRGADEKALGLELQLFEELINDVRTCEIEIAKIAKSLAILDVLAGFAELAQNQEYSRPELSDTGEFNVQAGRHPVVEAMLGKDFIPNSCDLGRDNSLWLLTGPNMAGKSTFLRQNALILVMAQMGSFVPAKTAQIGVADRLFSRVGASDDLARGRSTFMVEMVETASILNQATAKSLVILDEIGRGTATFDGLSIAWAVVEHLHDKVQARALFATHYHELTALASRLARLACHSMKVKEWKKEVIFLHEVGPGNADRSYGVHVAALAGLPGIVVKRAEEILARLEKSEQTNVLTDLPLFSLALKPEVKAPKPSLVEERLKEINPDELAPKAALELIYELKSLAVAKE